MARRNPEGGGPKKETAAERAARETWEEGVILVDLEARFGPFSPPTAEQHAEFLRMEAEDRRRKKMKGMP